VGRDIDVPEPLAEVMARAHSVPEIASSLDDLGEIVLGEDALTSVP